MHQSIPSTNIPPGQPPGIFPNFQPGSRDLYHLNFPETNMLKHTRNTNKVESVFISRFTMNNIAQKLQKAVHTKLPSKSYNKCYNNQISFTVSLLRFQKTHLQSFFLSTTFGLNFMISSVAPSTLPVCRLVTHI